MQILPSLCFETHPIKFYGKEKHNAKILSIYLSKFDEKSQNYPSIKVHVKYGHLVSSSVLLPEILRYANIELLEWFPIFVTRILKTIEEYYEK